jgi:hypothetical protein
MSLIVSCTLAALPPAPTGRCPQVRASRRYLEATHASVTGLLDSFNVVREQAAKARGNARGRLSRDQVDLLRAALVFTSSGLDATCQSLVRDCVPTLIDKGGNAEVKFQEFLRLELRQSSPSAGLEQAVIDRDPRGSLLKLYIDAKTRSSYQRSGDLKSRARDVLGITNAQLPGARLTALDGFFRARNDIVHRLDYVETSRTSTKRHHRSPDQVVGECDKVLRLAADLIEKTAALVK